MNNGTSVKLSKAPRTDEDAEIVEHRRQSYLLWQQMAGRSERGRTVLGTPTRVVSEWLVDRLSPSPGQTILDLAAGTGETGFLAASRLADTGRLISSDFAPQMVEAAARVAKELAVNNAEFRVLDGEELALPDASVDGVLCRFGYMLMGSPVRALIETRRVLRAGCRLAFAVWGDPMQNPWMSVAGRVMIERGHLSHQRPDRPGMFRLSNPELIRALLSAAGFEHTEIEAVPVLHRFVDADALWAFTSEMQVPLALAIAKLDAAERTTIRAAIEARALPFKRDAAYELPGLAQCVVAS